MRNQDKPEINYPTPWTYCIVGPSEDAIRAHVAGLLSEVEHELVGSRRSSGGRYVSLNLSLTVQDETQRIAIFNRLVESDAVKVVI